MSAPSTAQPGAFLPLFLRLSAVNVLSNLMVPLASLIDLAFLGHLAEIRHLAGVALATVLFNYLYLLLNFLRMGTTGTTAQAIGRQDGDAVLLIGLRHGAIALGLGLLILLLQVPIKLVGFAVLSATPDVRAAATAYYDALIWGAPANLLGLVLVGWFLGRSQASQVLLLSAIVSFANVGLDYWFIVRWGWGSQGAGAATALSQTLMTLVGLGLVFREIPLPRLRSIAPRIWDRAAFQTAFQLNREILIRTFALVTAFSIFTNLSSSLGATALATNTVLLQVISLAAYFIDGLAYATESIAGLLQGQGDRSRLQPLLWIGGSISLGLGLLFATLFITQSQLLFRLLTSHQDVLDQIQRYVVWLLPVLGFGSIAYALDGYFLGLTQGKILRQSSLIATLVGFLPIAAAAWHWQNPHLLWLALASFMLTRAITLGLQVRRTWQG